MLNKKSPLVTCKFARAAHTLTSGTRYLANSSPSEYEEAIKIKLRVNFFPTEQYIRSLFLDLKHE